MIEHSAPIEGGLTITGGRPISPALLGPLGSRTSPLPAALDLFVGVRARAVANRLPSWSLPALDAAIRHCEGRLGLKPYTVEARWLAKVNEVDESAVLCRHRSPDDGGAAWGLFVPKEPNIIHITVRPGLIRRDLIATTAHEIWHLRDSHKGVLGCMGVQSDEHAAELFAAEIMEELGYQPVSAADKRARIRAEHEQRRAQLDELERAMRTR